jgi:hypothetical protein
VRETKTMRRNLQSPTSDCSLKSRAYRSSRILPLVLMLATAGSAQVDLRVEGLNVSAAKLDPHQSDHVVTITFRITNAGKQDVSTPFRTSVSPGNNYIDGGFPPSYITTGQLASGKSVYVSEVVDSAILEGRFNIRVEADPDQIIADIDRTNNIVTSHYENDPQPGRWVSIGPTRITSVPVVIDGQRHAPALWKDAVGVLGTIVLDPVAPDTIYVASGASGVWRAPDASPSRIVPISWRHIADSLPTLSVSGLAVARSAPSRIYIATAGQGVYRSDTSGEIWTQVSGNQPLNISGHSVMLVHPTNSDLVYLTSNDGVYRSQTGGATWDLSQAGGGATDLVMSPQDPAVLYTAISGQGVYLTSNGGVSGSGQWARLGVGPGCSDKSKDCLPINNFDQVLLAIVQSTPSNRLYAAFHRISPNAYELYYSDDAGTSWKKRSSWTDYTATLGVHPGNTDIVYLGGVWFRKSTDGGASFRQVDGVHEDLHGFATDATHPDYLYVVCDGGIYRSLDSGQTWNFIGEGIANVQFYDHAVSAIHPDVVIGGTQDVGVVKYDGASIQPMVWTQLFGGDGGTVDIQRDFGFFLIQGGQYLNTMTVSYDEGASFYTAIADGVNSANACFYAHFQFVPTLVPIPIPFLLASCHGLWSTTLAPPSSTNWSQILPQPSAPSLEVVRSAVDVSTNLYYAGTTNGEIWAGLGGANWTRVFCDPGAIGIVCPSQTVKDIRIDPKSPLTIYVAFNGSSSGRVFLLRRTSQSSTMMTPTDITFDLPQNLTVNSLAIDPINLRTVFVGTEQGGVYRGSSKDNATWSWVAYNNGLHEAVAVRDLEVHPTTSVIRAATFGRGVYEVTTTTLLMITTISLTDVVVGATYSQTLSAAGGTAPYLWAITGGRLPIGLTLNATTGQITGTPTSPISSFVTFQVTDSSVPVQIATVGLTFTILPNTFTITTTSLPNGQVGVAYLQTLSTIGGAKPVTWELTGGGALPPGLTLDKSTGVISGTPTATVTNYRLLLRVTDATTPTPQTAVSSLTLTIVPSP